MKFTSTCIPSKDECIKLLDEYNTPKHVKAHCMAVGDTAKAISKRLKAKGVDINVEIATASGYLHDIARVSKNHEEVGADYLLSLGLGEIASVVRYHKVHRINKDIKKLTELDILCIADRTVLENKYVGAKERMEYIKSKAILKFGKAKEKEIDDFIVEFIAFIKELEKLMDIKIEDILPRDIVR